MHLRSKRPMKMFIRDAMVSSVAWPSGLRRWSKAPVCKGVGSNPTAARSVLNVTFREAWPTTKSCGAVASP